MTPSAVWTRRSAGASALDQRQLDSSKLRMMYRNVSGSLQRFAAVSCAAPPGGARGAFCGVSGGTVAPAGRPRRKLLQAA
eukprot:4208114-Alexandrium_andersonii.AAC.1